MKLIDYKVKYEKNKEDNELKLAYLKACYDVFSKADGYKNEIKDLAWYEGVSVDLILKNAKEYVVNVLGMEVEDFFNIIHLRHLNEKTNHEIRKSPGNLLILNLMGIDDKNEIIKIIDAANIKLKYLKEHIYDFIIIYYPNKKYLIEVLREKVDVYLEYKNNERNLIKEEQLKNKETKKYNVKKVIIEDFIKSDFYRIVDFCEDCNLNVKEFEICMNFIKKIDKDLYQKYLSEIQRKKLIFDRIVVDKIKQMVYFIDNGIKDNDIVRKFDIIDYYQYIGLNILELYWYLNNYEFSTLEIKKIKILVDKDRGLKDINSKDYFLTEEENVKNILNDIQEYGAKKDSKGLLVSGTGRIIRLDEKEKIIEFLRKIKAPLTVKNYKVACRRYVNGTLLFDDNEIIYFYNKKIIK